MDEKWAFVGKKEKRCDPHDPADAHQGDHWDLVAYDPEHRLVLSVVTGKRTLENVEALVHDAKRRTGGRMMRLITSDEFRPYRGVILQAYGRPVQPRRTGRPGRPRAPYWVARPGLHYAVVHKQRRRGRVVRISRRVIFGTPAAVRAALAASPVSRAINTAFVERQNATDRHHNARKRRKTYCFSKDWHVHQAVSWFTLYSYNFCWPVRTLRRQSRGGWQNRTPAMSAGLTDRVWTLNEWLSYPAAQHFQYP